MTESGTLERLFRDFTPRTLADLAEFAHPGLPISILFYKPGCRRCQSYKEGNEREGFERNEGISLVIPADCRNHSLFQLAERSGVQEIPAYAVVHSNGSVKIAHVDPRP